MPAHRGSGLGGALLSALTAGLPHDRLVLMTSADDDDPARRLYKRFGWQVIGPGLSAERVIMGKVAGLP
jgi:ribosomal protein S18 acetylase RimI-like enzyme